MANFRLLLSAMFVCFWATMQAQSPMTTGKVERAAAAQELVALLQFQVEGGECYFPGKKTSVKNVSGNYIVIDADRMVTRFSPLLNDPRYIMTEVNEYEILTLDKRQKKNGHLVIDITAEGTKSYTAVLNCALPCMPTPTKCYVSSKSLMDFRGRIVPVSFGSSR